MGDRSFRCVMKTVIGTAFVIVTGLCPYAAMARAPYYVDDAGITDTGKIQSANWLSHSNKGDNFGAAGVAFQIVSNFETTLQTTRELGNGDSETSLTLQGKYLWRDASAPSTWANSVAAGTTYDVQGGAISGAYAYIPVTFGITPAISMNGDMGWQYTRPDSRNFLMWGLNASMRATDAVSFTGEIFGKDTGRAGQQAGVSWQAPDQVIAIDLVYGHDIDGTDGNWVTTGITLLF